MAILVPQPRLHAPDLLPSGQLWLPRPELTTCFRGVAERSTLGHVLSDAERMNHFPATPLCTLTWIFDGQIEYLRSEVPGRIPDWNSPRQGGLGRWILSGPQTAPVSFWSPSAINGMLVPFLPDAFQLLTGLSPHTLTNRQLDARSVLPPDWLPLFEAVYNTTQTRMRVAYLENFLTPRWQACRPTASLTVQRLTDWTQHLVQRAALSAPGRSLRQIERRIKGWAGLPLRELRGFGRAERAFFAAMEAWAEQDTINWANVAADTGFSDQSHLCRVTRRITGFSPQALLHGMQREEAFWMYRLWV